MGTEPAQWWYLNRCGAGTRRGIDLVSEAVLRWYQNRRRAGTERGVEMIPEEAHSSGIGSM
jgi:hypothetical protein